MKKTILCWGLIGLLAGNPIMGLDNGAEVEDVIFEEGFREINRGLYFGEFESPQKSPYGDSFIDILKIDPKEYSLRLITASETDGEQRTAKEWAQHFSLIAVINAGMYYPEPDLSNVGYMRNYDHINNPRLNKYNAVFAFNPKDESVSDVQIIDRQYQDFDSLRSKYNTLIQGIRMVDIRGENRWSQQERMWSESALGMDKDGNVLFIHSRSPYSVYDLNNILLNLPINLYNAMHLDGGPVASLYINSNGLEIERVGSYETGFMEDDSNDRFWPFPNVIGIVKKD